MFEQGQKAEPCGIVRQEPEFRSIFSLNLSVTAVCPSEAGFNDINAGNHGE
jgi:hypothetical protein